MFSIGEEKNIVSELFSRDKKGTLTDEYILKNFKLKPISVINFLIDKEEYQGLCFDLIKKDYRLLEFYSLLDKIFNNPNAINFVFENLDDILTSLKDKIQFINYLLCYAKHNNKELYKLVAYSNDLNIRNEVMHFLSQEDRDFLRVLYPHITDYFVIKENDKVIAKMKEIDVSIIAANLFDCVFDVELFTEIKEFIFANYHKNHLLGFLAQNDEFEDDLFHFHEEIMKDFKRLYRTSFNYKLAAIDKYEEYIPKYEYLELFRILKLFRFQRDVLEDIFERGMGEDFIHLLKKYFAISENSTISYNSGSVTDVFAIGDFVIKFISGIHTFSSIEERYFPCFLVNKVVEEKIYYDEDGKLLGILQVGQRQFRPVEDKNLEKLFEEELERLGYFVYDGLIERKNLYYLNDYHDADIDDPETLPDWFKENPVMLVDLDLMFRIEQKEEVEKYFSLKK